MVWTYLRACYGFNMRVWVGGVETIYPARWFFCDPDAKPFASPHGAEASPWLKQFERNLEWGDDGTLKKLDRGINPGYPGICSVGDPQWFIDGHLPASVGVWKTPVLTPCCGHLPPANSDARCPQDPFVPCVLCQDGTAAAKYLLKATGGTGSFAAANGDWILTPFDQCQWTSYGSVFPPPPFPPIWALTVGTASGPYPDNYADAQFTTGVGLVHAFYVIDPPYDCLGPRQTMPLTSFTSPTPGQPPTITLEPYGVP